MRLYSLAMFFLHLPESPIAFQCIFGCFFFLFSTNNTSSYSFSSSVSINNHIYKYNVYCVVYSKNGVETSKKLLLRFFLFISLSLPPLLICCVFFVYKCNVYFFPLFISHHTSHFFFLLQVTIYIHCLCLYAECRYGCMLGVCL